VEFTPVFTSKDIFFIDKYEEKYMTDDEVSYIKSKMEKKVINYIPDFLDKFEYKNYFLSIKSKFDSTTDSRYPVVIQNDNIINCFTGKIQGIFVIEDTIKNIIDGI
jgi:hypothetical protein